MNNKTLAIFMLIPIVLSFGGGLVEGMTGEPVDPSFYIWIGIFTVVFVIWGAVRLYKTPDSK